MMRYMAAKICKIKNYEVKSGCSYFFDNNVWMLLFAKIAGAYEDRQKKYSSLLNDIKNRDGIIFISSLIINFERSFIFIQLIPYSLILNNRFISTIKL